MGFWKLCIRFLGIPSLLPHMQTTLHLAKINKNVLNCCWLVALRKTSNPSTYEAGLTRSHCLHGVGLGGGGLPLGGGVAG